MMDPETLMLFLAGAVPFLLGLAWAVILAIVARTSSDPRGPSADSPLAPIFRRGLVISGIVVPLVCEAADMLLFLGRFPAGTIAEGWFCAFHGFIVLEVFALATWLLLREQLGAAAGFFAGAFVTGALFAGIVGVGMLPFTLVGAALGIGILGVCPFFTVWGFRSAWKAAWHDAKARSSVRFAAFSLVAGSLLALILPVALQIGVQVANQRGFFGPGGADELLVRVASRVAPGAGSFHRW